MGGPRALLQEARRSWRAGRYTDGFRLLLHTEKSIEAPLGLFFATATLFYTSERSDTFVNNVLALLSSAIGVSNCIFEFNDLGADSTLEQAEADYEELGMAALRSENERLRQENDSLRAENAKLLSLTPAAQQDGKDAEQQDGKDAVGMAAAE